MNFFHHKDVGNHLLQLCPKVVKHPVYKITVIFIVFLVVLGHVKDVEFLLPFTECRNI